MGQWIRFNTCLFVFVASSMFVFITGFPTDSGLTNQEKVGSLLIRTSLITGVTAS